MSFIPAPGKQISVCFVGQLGLHRESKANQDYIVRPCLKKGKTKHKNHKTTNQSTDSDFLSAELWVIVIIYSNNTNTIHTFTIYIKYKKISHIELQFTDLYYSLKWHSNGVFTTLTVLTFRIL